MTLREGNIFHFHSSQQLPHLRLGPLKGAFWTSSGVTGWAQMSHDTIKKVDANFDYVIVANTPTLLLIAFGFRVALL